MEFNQYDHNIQWIPQQNPPYQGRSQQQPPRPAQPQGAKRKPDPKMPKAQALALANRFKQWLAVASIVSFGTFGGLIALHQVSSTTTQTTTTSSQSSKSVTSQQGGNNLGTSTTTTTSTATPTATATATSTPTPTPTATSTTTSSAPVSGTKVS